MGLPGRVTRKYVRYGYRNPEAGLLCQLGFASRYYSEASRGGYCPAALSMEEWHSGAKNQVKPKGYSYHVRLPH